MNRFRPYYKFLIPVKWYFIGALITGVIYALTAGAIPLLLKKILPALFSDKTGITHAFIIKFPEWLHWQDYTVPTEWLLPLTLSLIPLNFVIRGFSHFYNTYWINLCGIRVLEGIRIMVFRKLQALHLGFFHKNKSGDIMSRLTTDTTDVKNVIVEVSNDLIRQPFTIVAMLGSLAIMVYQNPEIVTLLIALAALPICIFPIRYVGKKIRKRSRQAMNRFGSLMNRMTESLHAPKEIRAYNLQEQEVALFREEVRTFFGLQMKLIRYSKILPPTIEFIGACGICFAVYRASEARIGLEDIIAVVSLLYLAYEPVKALGTIHNKVQQGYSGLDRIEEILHTPIEIEDPADPLPFKNITASVQFENVNFSYHPDEPILQNINLNIKPGESVAIVGPSGAGKSTIANLVPRFYDVTAGSIKIDGKDIRNVLQHDLRAQIATVSQEPVLFNDTIYNNIRVGKLDATAEEIYEAARKAFAYDFVTQIETGFDTIVGEKGTRLSGGQKQRIAIARAFLKNAPILILDEATSALDTESESKVQAALETLIKGKTTIIIAHRFSTIKVADRIVVLDHGKIISEGTHETVYKNPLYRRLYDQQNYE